MKHVVQSSANVRQPVNPLREVVKAEAPDEVFREVAAVSAQKVIALARVVFEHVINDFVDLLGGNHRPAQDHRFPVLVVWVLFRLVPSHPRDTPGDGTAEVPLHAVDLYANVEETAEFHWHISVRKHSVQVPGSARLEQVVYVDNHPRARSSRLRQPGVHWQAILANGARNFLRDWQPPGRHTDAAGICLPDK